MYDTLQIIEADSGEERQCLEPCTDQQYSVATTSSSYPAQPTFPYSKEACFLVIKFFEKCKVSARLTPFYIIDASKCQIIKITEIQVMSSTSSTLLSVNHLMSLDSEDPLEKTFLGDQYKYLKFFIVKPQSKFQVPGFQLLF